MAPEELRARLRALSTDSWEQSDRLYFSELLAELCRLETESEAGADALASRMRMTDKAYAERDAARAALADLKAKWICFSCSVRCDSEVREKEPCPLAHEAHWGHEWVSERVLLVTQKCVEHIDARDAARSGLTDTVQLLRRAKANTITLFTALANEFRHIGKGADGDLLIRERDVEVELLDAAIRKHGGGT